MAISEDHKDSSGPGWKGPCSHCQDRQRGIRQTDSEIGTFGTRTRVENRAVLAGGMMAPEYMGPKREQLQLIAT